MNGNLEIVQETKRRSSALMPMTFEANGKERIPRERGNKNRASCAHVLFYDSREAFKRDRFHVYTHASYA